MTKLTRKLFVSIMTLVLTVMALGTSTFAWFSMNTTANANSMQVTAKSNATYLLIGQGSGSGTPTAAAIRTEAEARTGNGNNLSAIAASVAKNVDAQNPDYTRYPSFFNGTGSLLVVEDLNGTKASDGTTAWSEGTKYTGVPANDWYTASTTNKAAAATEHTITNVKPFDEDSDASEAGELNFNDYVVEYVFYLTLTNDSEAYAAGNRVQFTYTLASGDAAISAVVKIEDSYYKLNSTSATATHTLTSAITKDTVTEVKVFIYVDGTAEHVYSDYVLAGNTITGTAGVQFDLIF